jgi:hypothetical protein
MSAKLTIDSREFSKWLQREMQFSKRDMAEAINQHAFRMNMAANKLTHRAAAAQIRAYLEQPVLAKKVAASGKVYKSNPPRAALILNKKGPGRYGPAMAEAISKFIKLKISHIQFLAAGFLPAVAAYAKSIGKTPGKSAARWLKIAGIGDAIVAKPGINPKAEFWNDAMADGKTSNSAGAMAMKSEALQRGMMQEVGNMEKYVARKIQQRNDRAISAILR